MDLRGIRFIGSTLLISLVFLKYFQMIDVSTLVICLTLVGCTQILFSSITSMFNLINQIHNMIVPFYNRKTPPPDDLDY